MTSLKKPLIDIELFKSTEKKYDDAISTWKKKLDDNKEVNGSISRENQLAMINSLLMKKKKDLDVIRVVIYCKFHGEFCPKGTVCSKCL